MDTQYILVLFSQIVKFLWHFGSVESIKKNKVLYEPLQLSIHT